jgi:hypothetical protein
LRKIGLQLAGGAIIWIPLIAIVVIAAVMFWQDASSRPVDTPGDRKDGRRDP